MRYKKNIKLVIFDLDGTLMDAYKPVERSINYTMKKLKLPPVGNRYIKKHVGWGVRHLVVSFVGLERIDEAVKIYRAHHKDALKRGTKFLPGAKRLLNYLKKNKYKLAVASNRPQRFSRIALKHLGILDYFDFILCGNKAKKPKPHPDILLEILDRFSLRPDEALFVGDMTVDVETGNRAKVKTIAVRGGSSSIKDIKKLKPLRLVSNIYEVRKILEGLERS